MKTQVSLTVSLHIFIFTYYLGPGKERKEFVCGKKIETKQQPLLVFLFSKANCLSCPQTGSSAFNPEGFQKESEMGICLKYLFSFVLYSKEEILGSMFLRVKTRSFLSQSVSYLTKYSSEY